MGLENRYDSLCSSLSRRDTVRLKLLSESSTEMMFFKKFAERQLQVFANKPPMTAQDKQVQEHQTKPRLEKGPIIFLILPRNITSKPKETKSATLSSSVKLQQERKTFLHSLFRAIRTWYAKRPPQSKKLQLPLQGT